MAWIVLIGLALIAILLAGWFINTSNRFKQKRIGVEQAFSNIDVWLTNRYNTLTKMVDTVRDYTKYESETLEAIVGLRDGRFAYRPGEVQGVEAAEGSLRAAERELALQVENYPQLKANSVFTGLQGSIRECEDNLQAAHRAYNASVADYNTAIVMFPASIVAGAKGLKPFAMFKADTAQRADISVRL